MKSSCRRVRAAGEDRAVCLASSASRPARDVASSATSGSHSASGSLPSSPGERFLPRGLRVAQLLLERRRAPASRCCFARLEVVDLRLLLRRRAGSAPGCAMPAGVVAAAFVDRIEVRRELVVLALRDRIELVVVAAAAVEASAPARRCRSSRRGPCTYSTRDSSAMRPPSPLIM